jgi:hypothetical protein
MLFARETVKTDFAGFADCIGLADPRVNSISMSLSEDPMTSKIVLPEFSEEVSADPTTRGIETSGNNGSKVGIIFVSASFSLKHS